MEISLEKVISQLRPGGSLVICDFFRRIDDKSSPISGGHRYTEFQEIIARYPLELVEEIDITRQTAITFTVIDQAFTEVLQPIWKEVDEAGMATHPFLFKLGNWFFKRSSIR